MGHPFGAFLLGIDDPGDANALQGFAVELVGGAGNDKGQVQVFQQHSDKDAGLDILVAQGEDGYIVIGDAQLAQGVGVGGVGAHGVGGAAQHTLDFFVVGVDDQHVVAGLEQFGGHADTEPPHSDNTDPFFHLR